MGNFGSNQIKLKQPENGSVDRSREKNNSNGEGGGMLFFLHRTWGVILTSKSRTSTTRKTESSDVASELTSCYSQYSFCSCSQCQRDDHGAEEEFSSGCYSDFFDSASCNNMAPNTEEIPKIENQFQFMEEIANKEKQRPPIYNPEDYAIMLKKWGKKSTHGGIMSLYANSNDLDLGSSRSQNNTFRDYTNPMLTSFGSEMTLRQFGTVSELLTKLKSDLRLAFPSFIQEFVSEPLDGITLLLDLLRAIQLSQSNTIIHGPPGSANTVGKVPPYLQRRALLDELSCLQCLLSCCVRYQEAVRKLICSSAGLFTVAVCIMSNVNKSRIIALQLLTKACDPPINGHSAVSEAMSTLRLRFGEPVRFRFLVGMLASTGGKRELIASGLRFLNKFLDTAYSTQKRIYIQAELDQAGLDVGAIKKNMDSGNGSEFVLQEIKYWEKNNIDIESLTSRLEDYKKENQVLKDRINAMERKMKILEDENGQLTCLEKGLKEKCGELQLEIRSLKSDQTSKISYPDKDELTPNEDEGISSSERSLSPENDTHPDSINEVYPTQRNPTVKDNDKNDNSETETTIEDVIEELNNIINDQETVEQARNNKIKNKKEVERKRIQEAQVASKLYSPIDLDDYEIEIIPQNLHPQPPRKAKSLVHLYAPSEDYYYSPKEMFFENDTPYTSDTSDSLLSALKFRVTSNQTSPTIRRKPQDVKNRTYKRRMNKNLSKNSFNRSESWKKHSVNDCYYYSTSVNVCSDKNCKEYQEVTDNWIKSKSLDRIDSGLDSMVDIVVTDQCFKTKGKSRSDSGNITVSSTPKSISNVYIQKDSRSFSSVDKQKMFLPVTDTETSYYFPRSQENKKISSINSTSFLIKRGHTNAGMYSGEGQVQNEVKNFGRSREMVALGSGSTDNGKVTDFLSGLY